MNKIEQFIRDITSVKHLTKSEARHRLDEILSEHKKELEEKHDRHIEAIKGCFNDMLRILKKIYPEDAHRIDKLIFEANPKKK